MKIDQALPPDCADAAAGARTSQQAGYDGVWAAETQHDPFLGVALATTAVPDLDVGTAITVAFARNPMTVAVTANDLQRLSRGKFSLGMGSQVKPHIERRFSMPWSHPAPRMREFVLAMRAIWAAWDGDGKLDFTGEFYRHTLMTPFFNPGPNPYGPPKVLLAGVGAVMTEVAGEVADGFLCHGFTTERFIREVTVPALERGAATAGRTDPVELVGGPFVVTGADEQATADADAAVRAQIAFYASTPAYRPVLELHGWADLQPQLNALVKQNRWAEMGGLIDDEVLDTFAVVAEPAKVAAELHRRYGDLLSRLTFYAPYAAPDELWSSIAADLRAQPAASPAAPVRN